MGRVANTMCEHGMGLGFKISLFGLLIILDYFTEEKFLIIEYHL